VGAEAEAALLLVLASCIGDLLVPWQARSIGLFLFLLSWHDGKPGLVLIDKTRHRVDRIIGAEM
jgi:hypothetical protein